MTLIYFIIILSVTVFVHELGHFIFAKKAKIYVHEFCVGMGPRIFKFKRKNDETTYGIRVLPIGGFCQMAGEDNEIDKDIPQEKKLQSKTWKQRFLTIIAGVMFNFIFAIILLFIIGLINGNPNNKPIINEVTENAKELQKNDEIISINDVNIKTIDSLLIEYQVNYGKDLTLKVKRNNEILEFTIKPILENDSYQYGFSLDNSVNKGFFEALKYSITKFISLSNQLLKTIEYLIIGKISINSLSGPIGIYNVVSETSKTGLLNLVYLTSYLCINVGLLNLLPLPAFDGGRILFLILEKIKGKKIDIDIENTIHAIGFILLMILMVFITYNDIIRFIIK